MGFLLQLNLRSGKIKLAAVLVCVCMAAFSSKALASGYEFDGVGVKQVIKGGAVTADESDWSAVYWNPAGLAGVPKQVGFESRAGKMYVKDSNSINIPAAGSFSEKYDHSSFIFGSAGGVLPLNDKNTIGFGFYIPLMNGVDFEDSNPANPLVVPSAVKMESFAGLMVGNISHSYKFNDKLSAGYGLNIIRGSLNSKIELTGVMATLIYAFSDAEQKLEGSGYGIEGVGGLKYAFNEKLTGALVFRTGSSVKINGNGKAYLNGSLAEKSDFNFNLKQPPTSSIGFKYQIDKTMKVSADFSQTWWKGFSNKITYDNPGSLLVDQPNSFDWKNSFKLRLGFEKVLNAATSVFGGYAFDTPAIDKNSVDFSTAVDVPMHRFSFGASRKINSFDIFLGALTGAGHRKEGSVEYKLSGWFFMTGANYHFGS